MKFTSIISAAISCVLAVILSLSTGTARASELSIHSSPTKAIKMRTVPQPQHKVTSEEFVQGLNELLEQGKLKLISSEESPSETSKVYGVVDPSSNKVFMRFITCIPKHKDRIWGAMWGWEPALTFNQTDQEAIATGGAAAVTAMAAATAAALSETVVGSVLSAGVIAFVGGAATVYVNKYGHCPASRPTLWVGTVTNSVACR
ncbi:hypothetical protein QS713_04340 [Gleimia hominis]|uniref:Uncharacterized protein n=1 Tax=Gleimia hominis TaxID=595468 RepID=A0ABU3IA99_9ACTO|nr:hypothetical protein [Gleimia hominis]MDT3767297.1 hypothetical protein [Gleimia hominis]